MNHSSSDEMMIDAIEEAEVALPAGVVPAVVDSVTYSASDESESTSATSTSTTIPAFDNSTTAEVTELLPTTTGRASVSPTTPLITRYDDSILWYSIVETKQYQIALTLNNVGISFLENEAYYDAVHILKKANSIMSHLLSTRVLLSAEDADTTSTNTSCSSMSLDKLNKYTQIAYDRLRSSERQKQRRLQRSNFSKKRSSFRKLEESYATSTAVGDDDDMHYSKNTTMFDVTVLQDSNMNELQIAADEYPTRNSGYVIRIDTTCKYYTSNFIVQASVISMNFAIARRCMINYNPKQQRKQSSSSQNASKSTSKNNYNPHRLQQREIFYTERAYKLYTYALTLLQQEAIALNSIPFNDYCSTTNDSIVSLIHRTRTTTVRTSGNTSHHHSGDYINVPMQQRIDLMTILAVQGLMYMALDLNLVIDANMYYCTLGDLHLSHTRYDTSVSSPLHNLAPAA